MGLASNSHKRPQAVGRRPLTAGELRSHARPLGAAAKRRIFYINLEHCPDCGGELRIVAVIAMMERPIIENILAHLDAKAAAAQLCGLPEQGGRSAAARPPPNCTTLWREGRRRSLLTGCNARPLGLSPWRSPARKVRAILGAQALATSRRTRSTGSLSCLYSS